MTDLKASTSKQAIARRQRSARLIDQLSGLEGLPVGRTSRRRARARGVPYVTLPNVEQPVYARPKRGETIRSFVDRTGWERRGLAMIAVRVDREGVAKPILRKDWDEKIRAADQLCFVARPAGGGGGGSRSIGAIVALIALMVVANVLAPGIGTAIAGATGLTIASSTIAAVIVAGGSLLISAFLAPKSGAKADQDTTFTAFLQGNRARPQQPIPVHYGRLKFTPDFAAQPWADFQGEDQVFYGLYTLGMGDFDIHEIGVADTPIWTAAGGVQTGFANFQYQIVEPDEEVTLFPVNVVSATEVSGVELPDPYTAKNPGPGGVTSGNAWVGPFVVNPAGTSGREVAIDVVFPGGCYKQDKEGKLGAQQAQMLVQYRYVDEAGVPIGGTGAAFTTLIDKTGSNQFVFRSMKPVRRTLTATLPTAGRIQVRAAITAAARRQNGTSVLYWQGARMFLGGSQTRPKATQLAVKILADQQFSGYSRQQLYVIATRKIDVWNGTAWVQQATQNPLWAFADFWKNEDYGCGRPLGKADLTTIATEAAAATSRGDTFNHRFTEIMSCMEALEAIVRPIAAKPLFIGGRLSLVRDKPRTIPNLMLTDLSISRGSVAMEYPLQTEEESDGVIVEYIDEQIWQPAEVSSSGSVATLARPARVQIPGVTNRAHATRLARYLAQTNALRRKSVAVDVEAEGRLVKLGDLVSVSSDVMALGGQTLRAASYTLPPSGGPRIVVDGGMPAPVWAVSGNHYVRVRRRNGRPFGPVLCSRGANDFEIVIDPTDMAAVQTAQGVTFASSMIREAEDEPVELSFSAGSPKEFLGLVTTLRVIDGGKFRLTLIEYNEDVYDVSGDIDPLPDVPALFTPSVPAAPGSVVVTMDQIGTGMTVSADWQAIAGASAYLAQISYDLGESWIDAYTGPTPGFIVHGVPANDAIVRVSALRQTERGTIKGPWGLAEPVTSPALDLQPSNVGYQVGPLDLDAPLVDRIWQGQAETDGYAAMERFAGEFLRQETTRDARASIVREEFTRLTEDSALAVQITALQASVGTVSAALVTEQTARASADGALVTLINTLTAIDGESVAGALAEEITVRANADSAITSSITALTSTVSGVSAAVTTEAATRASADSALAASISSLSSTVGGVAASVTSEAATRASADTALSGTLTALTSTVSGVSASVAAEATTRANADTALSTSISSLTSTVAGVSAAVTSEATTRASADSALSTSITGLTSTVAGVSAALTTETSARATGDSALAATISSLAADLDTAEAAITTEASTRATADTAIAASVTSLTSTVGGVSAGLTSEISTRASADSALSASISSLTSTVSGVSAAVTSEASTRASADSALAADISSLTTTVGGVSSALSTETSTRATADSALAASITTLTAETDQTATSLEYEAIAAINDELAAAGERFAAEILSQSRDFNATASVVRESFVRQTGDQILAADILALTATVGGVSAAVSVETSARVAGDSALAAQLTDLNSEVDGVSASLASEVSTRASADSAISASLASLTSTVGGVSAALSTESSTRASADSAISASLSSLTSTVGGVSAGLDAEISTRASADTALAASISSLTATVGGNTSAISTEATARAAGDAALSSTISTVSAQANRQRVFRQTSQPTAGGAGDIWFDIDDNNKCYVWSGTTWEVTDNPQISANTAAISTEAGARASADSAIAASVSSLTSTVGGVSASLSSESATRASADSALSTAISAVEATSNAGTATGRIRFIAASSLDAGVAAAFDVQVRADISSGAYSESGLRIEALSDGTSRIVMTADKLLVRDPTLEIVPFAVVSGQVVLQGVTRVGSTITSNAIDSISGLPRWSIDPAGKLTAIDGEFSGTLTAVELGLAENLRMGRGAKILNGQWPPWQVNYGFIGPGAGLAFQIGPDSIATGGTLGSYFFQDERKLSEPFAYTSANSAGTGTTQWLMPDGILRETANLDTIPTIASTRKGFIYPLDWNPAFYEISYPYKMYLPSLGNDRDFEVPEGCTRMAVKLWGAGGGTGANYNTNAGAGGFVQGTIAVTPGDKIRVQVGAGGSAYSCFVFPSNTTFSGVNRGYAGAGAGKFGNATQPSGGGRTAVFKVNSDGSLTPLFIAAGGGSSSSAGGGSPGGVDGLYGSYHTTWASGAGQGQATAAANEGGGGGGWKGGINGQGGANYIDAAATSTNNLSGSGATPPNTGDADYAEFVARTGADYSPGRAYGLNNRSWIIATTGSAQNGRFGNGGLAVIELLNT